MHVRRILFGLALLLPLAGCASYPPLNWFQPGPAPVQQSRAVRFDPYPEKEVGPEVVGGRPREYQAPPSEPVRSQQWQNPWAGYGR